MDSSIDTKEGATDQDTRSHHRGFSGIDNQFRELPIKTGMAVGGDNQISVEISPCSVEITYYHPTASSS